MVLFAFSSTPGNGYVISSGDSSAWKSIPEGLSAKIKATAAAGDTVLSVSIGKDDWFINTSNFVYCCPSGAVTSCLSSAQAQSSNVRLADIEQFVFMPHTPTGYFCSTAKTSMWSGLPTSMAENLRLSSSKADIRCVAVGAGEQWIIVREDNSFAYNGISDDLEKTLKENHAASKTIKYITFSLDNASYYFVVYKDGSTVHLSPAAWHPQIKEYIQKSQERDDDDDDDDDDGAALLDLASFNADIQSIRNAVSSVQMHSI
ncbi:hypothetical protein CPB83DRAFT_885601 [Crepidotus variabilis]|uniref:Uncharacterized protein n=1 Tax=Crepidotus variabilis TaxID=179855 RepID=A0A9P6JM22_9AGAR|nr:hypothetical protein CPB83DRAFT_885601 [Crepidotus variabilis]